MNISRGKRLIMQQQFNIEAVIYAALYNQENPNGIANFGFEYLKDAGYTNAFCSIQPLHWFPDFIGDKTWSIQLDGNRELTSFEKSKMQNLFRIQYEDDNLNPNNKSFVNRAGVWFEDKRNNPDYDNIILSVNMPAPFWNTDQELTYYLQTIKPDMIMFNRYPWDGNGEYNVRDKEYGFYAMLTHHRNVALSGIDRTGETPIPFGSFTQAFHNNTEKPIPDTLMIYNNYLPLAFGAQTLSTFIFNDFYSQPHRDDLRTVLFDKFRIPTGKLKTQSTINKGVKNLGKVLNKLHSTDVKLIRGTNIEFPVQELQFQGGQYDWETRPDSYLKNVLVFNDNGLTQDVWVGYFDSLVDSNKYFMIVNGSWDEQDMNHKQKVRLFFDFLEDETQNVIRMNRITGREEILQLKPILYNYYYLDIMLNAGEGDLLWLEPKPKRWSWKWFKSLFKN